MQILLLSPNNLKNVYINSTLSLRVDFLHVYAKFTVKVCMIIVEILSFLFPLISKKSHVYFLLQILIVQRLFLHDFLYFYKTVTLEKISILFLWFSSKFVKTSRFTSSNCIGCHFSAAQQILFAELNCYWIRI